MSKTTVTRLFIGSLIAVVAGAIVAVIAVALANANGMFATNGTAVVAVDQSPLAWALLGLGLVGGLAILGGVVGGFVSWIGALLNTSQLESKTWFLAILLLGIFNLGFFAMIAYVIAGPNGTSPTRRHRAPAAAGA